MADWTTIQLNLRYHWKTAFLWVIGVGGALALLLCTHERAEAWVQGYQPFPEGEATVVTTPFCRSGGVFLLPLADPVGGGHPGGPFPVE